MDGCTVHVDLGGSATAEDYTALIRLMHFEFGVDLITPANERPMQFSPLESAIPPLGLRDMIIDRKCAHELPRHRQHCHVPNFERKPASLSIPGKGWMCSAPGNDANAYFLSEVVQCRVSCHYNRRSCLGSS
jgi:hypothetical protein